MRKILITNDDGIQSDGIRRLAEAAMQFGEVWVIAPLDQCSAMSHRITLREPIDVFPADFPVKGVHAYATTGTPADCVRFGILNILKEKPDVVFSGINFGYNCGSDIQYSATVGATMEAACVGVRAIAFSEGFSENHSVTDAFLGKVMGELIDAPLGFNQVWNVNFPDCPLEQCKGILRDVSVSPISFYQDSYDEENLENGGLRLRVNGHYREEAPEGTDYRAIVEKYVSIGVVNNLR